jgi:hypothetical protein
MSQIKWPTGFNKEDLVGWGNFGFVCLDSSTGTVVKSPHLEGEDEVIRIEKAIYERFEEHGGHMGLLRYFGPYELGLRLEFASNYGLRNIFRIAQSLLNSGFDGVNKLLTRSPLFIRKASSTGIYN